MQMIDQYQKQQPVFQHHSIEEGSDDDDDSDSASQSQAQRSKQGDMSPVSYLPLLFLNVTTWFIECICMLHIDDEGNLTTK